MMWTFRNLEEFNFFFMNEDFELFMIFLLEEILMKFKKKFDFDKLENIDVAIVPRLRVGTNMTSVAVLSARFVQRWTQFQSSLALSWLPRK